MVEATSPARSALPWNLRAACWTRRLALPVCLAGALVLWANYGLLAVPEGMDTLPDSHPPGTRCLIEKRPRRLRPGAVVFVDVHGGTVLARVRAVTDAGVELAHDNEHSRFAALAGQTFPLAAVRGLVLVALTPTPEAPHGR
jgi:hypothetical protein